MSTWTPEKRQKAIDLYESKGPTEENTMDLVKEVAEELEMSANGVRRILSAGGVYVTKAPVSSKAEGAKKSTRVNKAEALSDLKAAIEKCGHALDEEAHNIIDRLTGKAAVFFKSVISKD